MANFVINKVTPEAYATAAQEFQQNLINLFGHYDKKEDEPVFTVPGFKKQAVGAYSIAESYNPKIPGDRYVMRSTGVDCVSGIVGLMLLRKFAGYVYVDYLAAHPLSSGAGFNLMKFARGLTPLGVIKLYDASDSRFYDELGFTPDEVGSKNKTFRGGEFAKPPYKWHHNPLYKLPADA